MKHCLLSSLFGLSFDRLEWSFSTCIFSTTKYCI